MKPFKIKYFVKHIVIVIILLSGYLVFDRQSISFAEISDACFLVGCIYLLIGLFRLTMHLRFYNLIIFGTKKLLEIIVKKDYKTSTSKTGRYVIYSYNYEYEQNIIEFITLGVILIVSSIITCLFS